MKTSTKHCESCNTEFLAKRFDAKFCSGACKQQAYLERIKTQNEQLEAKKVQEQAELSLRLKGLQKEYEELKKIKDAEQKLTIEESHKQINNTLKKFESDIIKRKFESANEILKGWLQQLLQFDQEEETSMYKVKSLYEEIIKSLSYALYDVPNDYKYFSFINNTLIPKVKNGYSVIQYSRERYINIVLTSELKRKFTDILYKID